MIGTRSVHGLADALRGAQPSSITTLAPGKCRATLRSIAASYALLAASILTVLLVPPTAEASDDPPPTTTTPAAPTVALRTTSHTSTGAVFELKLSWTAPTSIGALSIGTYNVRYRKQSTTTWTDLSFTGTGNSTTVSNLTDAGPYEAQVQVVYRTPGLFVNQLIPSAWSATGTQQANRAPKVCSTDLTEAHFPDINDMWIGQLRDILLGSFYCDDDGDVLKYGASAQYSSILSVWFPNSSNPSVFRLRPESLKSSQVTHSASDGRGGTLSRSFTVNVNHSMARSVAENASAGTHVGAPLSDKWGQNRSYSISGDYPFVIDENTGQISVATGANLDYETRTSYPDAVNFTLTNPTRTVGHPVTINLNDQPPPSKPAAPTVTRSSTSPKTALDISWTAPTNTGPAINDYDVQYRKSGASSWTSHAFTGTGTSTSISSLAAATTYEVQVRASSGEGTGDWSDAGTGTTNRPPVFSDGDSTTRSVAENSAAGTNVGDAVTATDADGDALTYSLSGSSAFTIDSGSGQIAVASGATLDYETTSSYSVTVTANDGKGDTEAIAVTINVTDVGPPAKPDAPTVARSSTSPRTALDVSWTAPVNTGRPAISDYDVQYRKSGASSWTSHAFTGTGTSTSISSLAAATYEVQVRASNAEGTGAWSDAGTGATNRSPVFGDGDSTTRSVAENSAAGTNVGDAVTATDADSDALTYSMTESGVAALAAFTINSGTGQISVKSGAALDYETTSSYNLAVAVSDGKGGTDAISVTINVTDVDESPGKPAAPTVARSSTSPRTALDVSWTAPVNTGRPAISDYDVQYRKSGASSWTSHAFTGTGTSTSISSLAAATTYEVQVRASNAEGTGAWSDAGTGATNRSPVFTEGDPNAPGGRAATREVAENTAAGQAVGAAVSATDADSDTLTYSLTDPGNDDDDGATGAFSLDSGTGQLRVAADTTLDYEAGPTTYTVMVYVTDGTVEGDVRGEDAISVTINVTDVDESPGKPAAPTVARSSTNPKTALDVSWTAPVNTGRPAISDYDVRYRKSGASDWTDHAFTGTGTRTTLGSLLLGTAYEVQVRASNAEGTGDWSDSGAGATRAETNVLPIFPDPTDPDSSLDTATRRVAENSAAGTNVGTAVTATDADSDVLTYALSGSTAFTIDSNSGQIKVAAGAALDYETTRSYSVTVTVTDGRDAVGNPDDDVDATITVTIDLTDVPPPDRPAAPAVTPLSANPKTALNVLWTAPVNTGRPAISDYDVRYRKPGASSWTAHAFTGTETRTTLGSLLLGTAYEVQVRASNAEGTGDWSDSGAGATRGVTNILPIFPDPTDPDSSLDTATRRVAENSAAGTNVGTAVTATDADSDVLTYALSGSTAFTIDSGSGQIKVAAGTALDYETTRSYSVTVTVTDGRDAVGNPDDDVDATITVTIDLTDVPPPDRPAAPAVTPLSANPKTALNVLWTAPVNTGRPAISDYDVRYRKPGASSWTAHAFTGTETRTTLNNLGTETTYEVQVRASNAEGTGDWSHSGTGATNRPPVFSDGRSTTRSVAENTPAGSAVGAALSATDADGDRPSFWMAGALADRSFTIDSNSGQIRVKAGVALDYEAGPTSYSVTVYAIDGSVNGRVNGSDVITVTINVTDVDEPPDAPDAPTVTPSSTSPRVALDASWAAPVNTGRPAISGYDLRYRKSGAPDWTDHAFTGTGTRTTLRGLDPDTAYEVQVRASNAEGAGGWSDPGAGATRPYPGTLYNPTANDDYATVAEGGAVTVAVLTNDNVVEIGPTNLSVGLAETPDHGVAAVNDDGTITYTHDGSETANDSFQYRINDGAAEVDTATVYITVTETVETDTNDPPTNDPPTFGPVDGPPQAGNYAFDLAENQDGSGTPVVLGSVTAVDPDADDELSYAITDGNAAGKFALDESSGQLSYVGKGEDYEAPPSRYELTVTATDEANGSATAAVTVTVTNVNEPPVPVGAIPRQILLTHRSLTIDSAPYFFDPDGDPLDYVASSTDIAVATARTSSPPVTVTAKSEGRTMVSVTTCDPDSACAQQTFQVEVVDADISFIPAELTVSEGGRKAYTVHLQTDPWGDVTVALTSGDTGAATVSPQVLTFTPGNWNTPQRVAVTGVQDDDTTDETVIVIHDATGGGYNVKADFTVTVEDDDTQSLTIAPAEVSVDEGAEAAQAYTVALDTQPTGAVTVTPTSGDTGAATVSPRALTFTPDNWNTPQRVAVTGIRDDDTDDETVIVSHAVSGADYDGVPAGAVTVTVADDDTQGLTIAPAEVSVDEGAEAAQAYTVALDTQPTGAVTVALTSGDTGAATVSPRVLTFTPGNWNKPQRVAVTGVRDDDTADETVIVSHAVSGADYDGVPAGAVTVTVADDDTQGLTIAPAEVSVDEGAEAAQAYTVALDTQPTGAVTVTPTSGDTGAATVSPRALTFTPDNWNTPQRVAVTGVQDDDTADETVTVSHAVSGADYDGVPAGAVTVMVEDDDTQGLTIAPAEVSVDEGAEAAQAYTVALDTQPTGAVTVTPTSGDTGAATVSPRVLTFTPGNWNTPQRVAVTGVRDDDTTDETVTVSHAVSGADYDGVPAGAVTVTVADDDTQGLTIAPAEVSVDEGAEAAQAYTVALDTQPTGAVTVTPTSGDTGAATVSPRVLTFTPGNWNTPQRVAVTGVRDDDTTDETVTVSHAVSGADYDGVPAGVVTVTVADDDTQGLTIAPAEVSVDEGAEAAQAYTVALDTQPTGAVTVTPTSGDTGAATVSPRALTFTPDNWNTPQRVAVTGVRDDDTADETVTVSHAVSGADYDGVPAGTVTVTVADDDTQGLTIAPAEVSVDEGAEAAQAYTVALDTQPTGAVTVTPTSGDTGAATVSPRALTFTPGNWNTPQRVAVTGVRDDDTADETVIVSHAVSGADYDGVPAGVVTVTVADDDTQGLTIAPAEVSVDEGAEAAQAYTVALDTQPTGAVTVTPTSGDTGAATVSPRALTFTPDNWNTPQRVAVTGVQDDDTTDETVTVSHAVSGADYDGVPAGAVTVTVADDDTQGLTIAPAEVSVDEGAEAAQAYTVALDTQPTGAVTVTPTSGDTGAATVSPRALTFTPDNWNTPQRVAVTGVQDDDTADETVTVSHAVSGADYDGVPAGAVTVMVEDDDTQGLTIAPAEVSVDEGAEAAQAYTVALDTQPTGAVTVTPTSGDTGAATVSPRVLTFTPGNWNTPQRVAVTGVRDDDTTDETVTVSHAVSGADYDGVPAGTVTVTVADDDTQGLTIAPVEVSVDEGAEAAQAYTVALDTQPTGAVTVTPTSGDTGAATVSPRVLTFTPGNWNTPQRVAVTGVQDDDTTDETVTVSHAVSGADYDGVPAGVVTVTVADDKEMVSRAANGWLARFGRAVAADAVDMIGERINRSPSANASQVTLGGHTLRLDTSSFDVRNSARYAASNAGGFAAAPENGIRIGSSGFETHGHGVPRTLSAQEVLRGSSFQFALGEGEGGGASSVWGRFAGNGFDGEDDGVHLDGQVVSGWLGVDRRLGANTLAGLAVSHNEGQGGFDGLANAAGEVEASLTSAYPYLSWSPSQGRHAWGILGFGRGDMHLTDDAGQVAAGIEMRMGAIGGRTALPSFGDIDLTLKTDGLAVRIQSDAARGLPAVDANVQRARLTLEGAHEYALASGGRLTPSLEMGLRHDWGAAETGFGFEIGAGVRYANPAAGLTVEGRARKLVAHRDREFEEWGMSGLLRLDPGADGQGLSFSLRPSWGAASSGIERFWGQDAPDLLADAAAGRRLDVEFGYGLLAIGGRGLLTPYSLLGSRDDGSRDYRLGARFAAFGPALELSLEGKRQETAVGSPTHGIMLRWTLGW